jgi:uncharacterized damage-inducible protein DinB
MLASYNRWANDRLYGMAAALTPENYRKDVGVFFKSLHGTLNHLLTADRIWMRRLEGTGDHPDTLDAIVCDDLPALQKARSSEDDRIVGFVEGLSDTDYDKIWDYQTLNGSAQRQPIGAILAHLFNHQTHHRGQAHAALTVLGMSAPLPLDLLIMLRESN